MAEVEIPDPHEVHEKAENPFSKKVALAVAVYAVILAIASAGGHNCSKDMMMAKQEESNAWNRFQAKSNREALYKSEVLKLVAEKSDAGGKLSPAKEKLLADFQKQADKMAADKDDIMEHGYEDEREGKKVHMKAAREFQKEVELMQKKDPYFDFAEVAMQLGIVLASVSMLSGKKWAFVVSFVLAVSGAALAVNGFFLLDKGTLLGGH
jgi:hypothetical protein